MKTDLIRKQSPEERELEKKKAELASLETELAERELELATFQAELRAFEQRYLRIVGIRYAELDEVERKRRHQFMVEVNRAYETSNEERLRAILHDWQLSPKSIKEGGVGAELVRLIRQIAQVEERIAAIDAEIAELQTSELAELKARVERAEDEGRDLLAEMAADLDKEIASAKVRGYDVLVKLFGKVITKPDYYQR